MDGGVFDVLEDCVFDGPQATRLIKLKPVAATAAHQIRLMSCLFLKRRSDTGMNSQAHAQPVVGAHALPPVFRTDHTPAPKPIQ